MRILAIHLRNLNSLAGSWAIDFTAGEYAASGIFAITGPTGAGKSTLLDAICLALFGRTPRLGSITKGSNEIMSRRAGDCFAEVSFATNSGRYRCHWGQHRARRKPGGELQTPKHEIVELASGKVLESRTREVVRMVEQVTGMDYDRFTRSILLAQGDFAAFLEADADQRAPILEQITGTSIYSQLSQATHERTSEERKKTAILQEALASLKLLSLEEEQEINAAIETASKSSMELRSQQDQVEKRLQQLSRIDALKTQLDETQKGLTLLNEQWLAAASDLQRLELGLRAQDLVPPHASLAQTQQRLRTLEQRERERSRILQGLGQTQLQLQQEHHLCLKHLTESQATRERELERIKEVRVLDLQGFEKRQVIQQVTDAVTRLEKESAATTHERQRLQQQLAELLQRREKLRLFMDEHAADALLVEQFAGLRQQLLHLEHKEAERSQLQQALETAHRQLQAQARQQQQLEQVLAQELQALNLRKQGQQQLLQQRERLLGAQSLPQLRQELSRQEIRLQRLEGGSEWAKQLQALQDATLHTKEQEKQLQQQHKQLQEQLKQLEQQLQLRRQLVEQCEENQQLSLRIRSYEQERSRLEEGQPCPLCGATHHPWQMEHPQTEDRETELAQARQGVEQSQAEIGCLRETLVGLDRDLEHNRQTQAENTRQMEALTSQLVPLLKEYELGPVATCAPAITRSLDEKQKQAEALRNQLAAIEGVDDQLQAQAGLIQQATDRHIEAIRQTQDNSQAVAARKIEIQNLDARLQETVTGLQGAQEELTQILLPFGCTEVSARNAQELLKSLATRLQQWKSQSAQQEELAQQEKQLAGNLEKQELQISNLASQLQSRVQERTNLQQQQEALRKQRHALYGELNPDVEEQRLRSLVQEAERREVSARNKLAANEKELHGLMEQQRQDGEELHTLRPKCAHQEAELMAQVQAAGFADMQAFRSAILPSETLRQLSHDKQQLEQRQVMLSTRKAELEKSLAEENALLDHTKTQPELLAEKTSLQNQVETLLQRIGANRERLSANQRLAQEYEQQRLALAAQQQELERWELLHHLIGSADGKKFRVFAQGLTFEVMVSHANRQLRKMSDRYILLRDPKEALALQVIDNYQAGEIRSTRNLSGGESFLVSLALSLGLSAMASHNVRVDSLFLDEGFGTLDEETLDTALQTLAELQQDGKLIGIISHVTLLKERIGLRIQVQPGADGCSRLLGPGCTQLA